MVDRHHPGKAPTALLRTLADGTCRTIAELVVVLDLTRKQVSDAAACLLRRDYLMRMGTGCYRLTDAGIAAAAAGEIIRSGPRGPADRVKIFRDTLRTRAWRAMRIRRRFSVHDLISDAAIAADAAPDDNIGRYLRSLRSAGYVAELPRRSAGTALTSNGFKRWMLVRDTGPLAPVVLSRIGAVHDRNTGEDVPCAPR
mgnify:CR=1 FL=1